MAACVALHSQRRKEIKQNKHHYLLLFRGCLIKTVPNCSRKLLSPFNRKLHGAFEHFTSSVGTDWLGAERSERTGRLKNILIVFFFSKNARSAVGVRVRFFLKKIFLNCAYLVILNVLDIHILTQRYLFFHLNLRMICITVRPTCCMAAQQCPTGMFYLCILPSFFV